MAISLTHNYVSTVAEDANSGKPGGTVGPTEWNAQHTLTQATNTLLGRGTAGGGATEEVAITNDTNVTGTLSAGALTLGWTGTLAAGRLNANTVQSIVNDTNVTGSISAQALTLAWAGTLAAGRLNSNVVQSIVNDTNVTGSISAQALTLAWSGTLAVGRGGIGVGTLTTNGVLYGNSTSAVQATAQGGANTVLTANAGAPSFSASPTIGTSITCPTHIGGTAAGSSLTLESTSGAGTSDFINFLLGSQAEAARFDTAGRFLVGSTSSRNFATPPFSSTAGIIQAHQSSSGVSMGLFKWQAGGNCPYFVLANSRGASIGTHAALSNGDDVGGYVFDGDDGTNFQISADIKVQVDAAVSTGIVPGRVLTRTANASGTLTERVRTDSAGKTSFTNTTGFGYGLAGNGDGGTIAQSSSKSTGVTLNTVTGQITMNAAALNAQVTVAFTLTNSNIATNDLLVLFHISGGTIGAYTFNANPGVGSAVISVRNVSTVQLAEAVVIQFVLIKAVVT